MTKNKFYIILIKIVVTLVFFFVFLECTSRLFFPKPFRILSNEIVLPSNQVYKIKNKVNPKLDSVIIHSVNSLGLRGIEFNGDSNTTKILTVGGSTTNCFYLNDKQEWTHQLYNHFINSNQNIWINNAGFSGQSTYGHILLLKNYLLKLNPKYIIFYIGINDLLRDKMSENDQYMLLSLKGFKSTLYKSRLLMLLENYYTTKLLKYAFINTDEALINYKQLPEFKDTNQQINLINSTNLATKLKAYNSRIKALINLCRENNIVPIFLTQASLFTCGYDETNEINLGIKTNNKESVCEVYQLLHKYNETLEVTCQKNKVVCIDMANIMTKNTAYYSDFVHFTPLGASVFALNLYENIKDLVK